MIFTKPQLCLGAVILWVGAVASGFTVWETYDRTPGSSAQPLDSAPPPTTGCWTLTMFAHPRCECTRASLTELREILSRTTFAPNVRIVFIRPKGMPSGWEQDELWTKAAEIPRVRVECDAEGTEARRAGATVSGYVLLGNPAGEIVFRGGITKSRGCAGDNAGRRTILALLSGTPTERHETPTFGCPLFTPRKCCEKEGVGCQP